MLRWFFLTLVLFSVTGCGQKFNSDEEEFAYLEGLSSPSETQLKRLKEIQDKATKKASDDVARIEREGRVRLIEAAQKLESSEEALERESAFHRYKDVIANHPGTPEATFAAERLEQREREREREAALNLARGTEQTGTTASAIRAYRAIVAKYSGTKEAATATTRLKELEPEAEADRKRMIKRARALEEGGHTSQALVAYDELADLYPDSEESRIARKRLQAIEEGQKAARERTARTR
jgi:hypothetical protein